MNSGQLVILSIIFMVPAALIAIPIHEIGHALAAHLQGDRTPINRGYLGSPFRPRVYFNAYGLLAAGLWNVSWGEPAPVNEYRLRGTSGRLWYALAGPALNLAVAIVFGLLLRLTGPVPLFFLEPLSPTLLLADLLLAVYFLNLATFAFNLLPIPGLDGWRVLEALFRNRHARFFFDVSSRRREIYAVLIIIVFATSFIGLPVLGYAVALLFQPASTLILGACPTYAFLHPCLR